MTDLKEKVKQRLLDEMIRTVKTSGWKVLVVDKVTLRIISAACRMYDIMEEQITLVEKIDVPRQPLPNLHAIYFLSPSEESVDLLIKDFEDDPTYHAVHLFFSAALPESLFDKLKEEKVVKKIRTMKELNLNFVAYERSVFHFDDPDSFKVLYSPESTTLRAEQVKIAENLVSLCATLKEYPVIRYQIAKDSGGSLSQAIAALVQDRLDQLARASPEYNAATGNNNNRATLLILDRSHDPISPILHEFTYQAMVYDLLEVENDHYKYSVVTGGNEEKTKQVILSELDPLWPTLRHMHIADTINWILDNFNEFVKENKATKLTSGKKVSNLREMADAMKAMPQFQEMIDKYSLHIHMANQCMTVFAQHKLAQIAPLEQDMATGEDSDGKTPKNPMNSMPPLLTEDEVPLLPKLRLLMLYIISQEGIKDSDRKRLMELANIENVDQGSVSNLRYLGVTLLQSGANRGKKKSKDKEKKKKKQRDDAPPYELSRWVPTVKPVIEDLIDGGLSEDQYPYLRDDGTISVKGKDAKPEKEATSLRKGSQPRWADKDKRKSEKKEVKTVGGKIIVFVAGGVTFSEMRSIYELGAKHNRDILIGGTSILTPKIFVESLRDLKRIDTAEEDD